MSTESRFRTWFWRHWRVILFGLWLFGGGAWVWYSLAAGSHGAARTIVTFLQDPGGPPTPTPVFTAARPLPALSTLSPAALAPADRPTAFAVLCGTAKASDGKQTAGHSKRCGRVTVRAIGARTPVTEEDLLPSQDLARREFVPLTVAAGSELLATGRTLNLQLVPSPVPTVVPLATPAPYILGVVVVSVGTPTAGGVPVVVGVPTKEAATVRPWLGMSVADAVLPGPTDTGTGHAPPHKPRG